MKSADPFVNIQAAVMVVIADAPQGESILLTKRATGMRLHSGEVAFPGGKSDHTDSSLLHTALRETHEEVALHKKQLEVVKELKMSRSRSMIDVYPFVARVAWEPKLVLSEAEIESAFWVPVDFFKQDKRLRTDEFKQGGVRFWAPAYRYDGHVIWGLTSRIIVDMLDQMYQVQITR